MDALECVGIDLNAEFMGDGRKMQDGVCRAGNCRVHDNGVFKALPRHDIAGRQAALCQLHSLCARFSGHFHKIRAGGRQKRAARQCKAQRLAHHLHRARRAHKAACTARGAGMVLIISELRLTDLTALTHGTVGTDLLQCQQVRPGLHNAACHHDSWQVCSADPH